MFTAGKKNGFTWMKVREINIYGHTIKKKTMDCK